MLTRLSTIAFLSSAALLSCADVDGVEDDTLGGGGAQASGGSANSGGGGDADSGGMASGGTASGGTASGGTASGGTASGGTASGGTASGGTASGGTASGGTASGGTASGGSAGSGGSAAPSCQGTPPTCIGLSVGDCEDAVGCTADYECKGFKPECPDYTTLNDCLVGGGCTSWSPFCWGTATPCADFDERDCARVNHCYWQ